MCIREKYVFCRHFLVKQFPFHVMSLLILKTATFILCYNILLDIIDHQLTLNIMLYV